MRAVKCFKMVMVGRVFQQTIMHQAWRILNACKPCSSITKLKSTELFARIIKYGTPVILRRVLKVLRNICNKNEILGTIFLKTYSNYKIFFYNTDQDIGTTFFLRLIQILNKFNE